MHTEVRQDELAVLGQGDFRYRVVPEWGILDPARYPVKDCHGIKEDKNGRIVVLTNDTHNNLIAYSKSGEFLDAWENRFPAAHGLEIINKNGEDWYWITDHDRQLVCAINREGESLLEVGPESVQSSYADITKYHPTCTAHTPAGDFFVADGYGSSLIHHFDSEGHLIGSFGGEGTGPENLSCPHGICIDDRSGTPLLLVCDRAHNMLKWFSLDHELLRTISLGEYAGMGPLPSNIALFPNNEGRFKDHLAIAGLNGTIIVLDGADRVVSVVGGPPPVYSGNELQPLQIFNYTFNHPHGIYVDATGNLYVGQWWSNYTYPLKLELCSGND